MLHTYTEPSTPLLFLVYYKKAPKVNMNALLSWQIYTTSSSFTTTCRLAATYDTAEKEKKKLSKTVAGESKVVSGSVLNFNKLHYK